MRFALVKKALPILAFTAISLVGVPASASPYSSMVVFGDSLSDNGNNSAVLGNNSGQVVTGNSYIPSAPYATGVYSNGPVWASDVASSLGLTLAPSQLGGTDFAYGGATTGTPGGRFSLQSRYAGEPISRLREQSSLANGALRHRRRRQ